jgi:hypothetical protein
VNSVQTSTAKLEAGSGLSNRRLIERPFGEQSLRCVRPVKPAIALVELEFQIHH